MGKFVYAGVSETGEEVKGSVNAVNLAAARLSLRDKQLVNVTVDEHKSKWNIEITKKKIPAREVMQTTRQLAAFVRAGVPLLDSLRTLRDESGIAGFRTVLDQIVADIQGGATLSAAVAEHPKVFPSYYVGMVQSAEASGSLDVILESIAEYMERDIEARRKIKAALIYPMIILALSLVTIVVLTTFVLPRFETFFDSLDAELPMVTSALLAVSSFVSTYFLQILAVIALIIFALYWAQRSENGKLRRDRSLLRLPAVGTVIAYSSIERFCRVLSTMVTSGVPLPQAMTIVTDTTANRVYKGAIAKARTDMIEGKGLSGPIAATGLFPSAVTQMVRVGEETGTLDEQLRHAAKFYERELDYKIKSLTEIFEPAILIFVGLVVGFVAVALVSAMYGIFRSANI